MSQPPPTRAPRPTPPSIPSLLALLLPLLSLPAPAPAADDDTPAPPFEDVVLEGRALPLADLLRQRAIPFDPQSVAGQLVLLDQRNQAHPLLRDDASRILFENPDLQNRPARVSARKHPGIPHLQVIVVRVLDPEENRYRIPEYYCLICSISTRYNQECPCCQGGMDFRWKPEADQNPGQ